MLGARGTLTTTLDGRGLTLRIKGSPNKINGLRIELDQSDTYTMVFMWVRGSKCTERARFEGVYADSMHELIRKQTGLEVRMPRVLVGGAR